MRIFEQLGKIYNDTDSVYFKLESEANAKRHRKKEAAFSLKRKLNDQAYFLFMFTRLEDRIKYLSDILITNKMKSTINWESKRAWDIINKRKDRMPLMDRVALLTDINGADYKLINSYYIQRNNIAHGGSFTIPVTLAVVIADLKRLDKDLKKK